MAKNNIDLIIQQALSSSRKRVTVPKKYSRKQKHKNQESTIKYQSFKKEQ